MDKKIEQEIQKSVDLLCQKIKIAEDEKIIKAFNKKFLDTKNGKAIDGMA